MNRILLPLLGLACWLTAGTATAILSDPAQIQTEAYVNLVQADQGLDAGRLDEALAQYQVARDYYQQLARDFPRWEPRIIQYRKTYCDNQVADIQRRLSGGMVEEEPELAPLPNPAAAPQPNPVVIAQPIPDRAAAERSLEIDYLKSRIRSLETELGELDTIQNKYDALQTQYAQSIQDLQAAQKQLGEQADKGETEAANLRTKLLANDKQIQRLQRSVEAKKELDQALNDMEAKVNELRGENKRLQKEIKTLDSELDNAEIRADQAQLAVKQAEAKLKDGGDTAKQLKKTESALKKSEKRVRQLEKAEAKLKETESRAKKAEKELKKARSEQADAEKQLTVTQRKLIIEKANRKKDKAKAKAQAQAKPEAKKKKKEPSRVKIEKEKEILAAAAVTQPFMATVPPKRVPRGSTPADYVRQLLQEGDNDVALATVQEARKSQPADMNLILIEGISLIRLQRYDEAATMLIDLAKHNPRNAEVHATLGAAMMGAGFYDEAREELLKATKLDRNLPECQYNLAQLYAFIEPINIKKARKAYKLARDLGLPSDTQLEKAMK